MEFLLDRLIISENSDSYVIFLVLPEKSVFREQFFNSCGSLTEKNKKLWNFFIVD